jgi:predicted glycogen debranching enzyme
VRTVFDQKDCQNFKTALTKEWLETNGLGGFACSSIIGANVRRQNGWLVAALRPPVERAVLLSKIEDRVVVNDHDVHLSTNIYPGTIFPHGFNIQTEFRLRPWPTFRYVSHEFAIERSLCLIHGENTVVISYHNTGSRQPIEVKARPLLAFRDYKALSVRNDSVNFTVDQVSGAVSVQPYPKLPRLFFSGTPCGVEVKPDWYKRFQYPVEMERGLEFEEDLFTPFELTFKLRAGETAFLVVATENKSAVDAGKLLEAERKRRKTYESEPNPTRQALLIAADSFLVYRGQDTPTVLAGYPWFTDWGRDTMIALPGLTLTAGKFPIAKKILLSFARYCDRGMIPNVFPDADEAPEYNTVDAPLCFVIAAWKYWKASGDNVGTKELLPALSDVVRFYRDGTRCDISADKDGLISAGTPGTQLTWMDVKVEGYVPTPRHGKAVEINALWLNVLFMLAEMEEKLLNDIHAAVILRKLADQVVASFAKTFWYAEGGYLYDVVQGNMRDPAIRPNQLFAVSLPYSPLSKAQQKSVFEVVTKQLLTPYGLRSLARGHEKYCGKYTGNTFQRDCAYHQGTVWAWLIGAYCDAYAKVNGKPGKKEMAGLLSGLIAHLEDAGLGSVSEIFEGDAPHRPVGCFAQAWSVSELLRVYDTYVR